MGVSNLLRNDKILSMSTISQGKVTTLMQKLNNIEQRIKKLHSLKRFVLETHFLKTHLLLSFIKKQMKLANLVLKHRIGYLTKAHQTTFLSCTEKCLINSSSTSKESLTILIG